MADKRGGYIADEIKVTPRRYDTGEVMVVAPATPPHGFEWLVPGDDGRISDDQAETRRRIDIARRAIDRSFRWSVSQEGPTFWMDICDRLARIMANGS